MHTQAPAAARLQARCGAALRGQALRRAAPLARAAPRRAAAAAASAPELTLYTLPVSNFGARPRLVIAWKGLQAHVRTAPPSELGGLKSEAYLVLNPQGKMPMLVLPDGRGLPESEVIVAYLLDKFQGVGPSLSPATPEARAHAALATRLHDVYLGPLQGCMYKEMPAAQRAAQLAELAKQLRVLEGTLDAGGPYVAGAQLSAADAALFPSFVFYTHMLPSKFGWRSVFTGKPRLERWWAAMCAEPHAAALRAEMVAALGQWEEGGRWDKLGITAQVADTSEFQWAH